MEHDTAFEMATSGIRYGAGVTAEIGMDLADMGLHRVLVFTDANLAGGEPVAVVRQSLDDAGVAYDLYDGVHVEPTDASFKDAIRVATEGDYEGYVAVGGGSSIDTAKAANLYATHPPADFLDYVNAPIGEAKPVPGPLKPHIACPTTFGTASECTGIAVFDLLEMEAKTGIAHAQLRPNLGILDPTALATLPRPIVAANGFDVFSHAVESLTARPFCQRPAPENSNKRPLGQGANPYSDLACAESIQLIGTNLIGAVNDADNSAAHEPLMFAGMLAGIGFGNAGCHLPHGMSYAVAGLVRGYTAPGWPSNHPMVPHGISVIVNAPAVFRYTGPACPERHLKAARAMGADVSGVALEDAGDALADRVIEMMRQSGIPNGLRGVGYSEDDLDALTDRAFLQKRLLDNSPRPPDREQLKDLFRGALSYW